MRVATADRESMEELGDVHGGAGPILFKRLWERDDFETAFTFVHGAVLLPGGGIGLHRHDDSEEIFITVDNASQFTHNGRTAAVEGGAAVPLRSGENHAIYNHTDRETRWFNVHCVVPGGDPKSTDLGDDPGGGGAGVDRPPAGGAAGSGGPGVRPLATAAGARSASAPSGGRRTSAATSTFWPTA